MANNRKKVDKKTLQESLACLEETRKQLEQSLLIKEEEALILRAIINITYSRVGTKCIVEDKEGKIVCPNEEVLGELVQILNAREKDQNEIEYNKKLYEYSEEEVSFDINGEKKDYVFKTLRDLSNEKDYLSGLSTRNNFVDKLKAFLKSSLGRKGEFAYVFMDFDRFKDINDKYGHEAGDNAIRLFGQVLRKNIRNVDIAGRYGGDEFILILRNITAEKAEQKIAKIREDFSKTPLLSHNNELIPHKLSAGACHVDCSAFDRQFSEGNNLALARKILRIIIDRELYNSKKSGFASMKQIKDSTDYYSVLSQITEPSLEEQPLLDSDNSSPDCFSKSR